MGTASNSARPLRHPPVVAKPHRAAAAVVQTMMLGLLIFASRASSLYCEQWARTSKIVCCTKSSVDKTCPIDQY